MFNTDSELYNDLVEMYFDENYDLSDTKRNKMKHKYDLKKLFFETYNYDAWSENEELSDTTRKSYKEELFDTIKTGENSNK